ncbi:5-formyltetrahydrofolate cyclo-ligase [Gammaproteobacteria bacterium]|nr:5-formyltetrahydrofolate cyclo-ligase [Gammaproteobacteria bacterium]
MRRKTPLRKHFRSSRLSIAPQKRDTWEKEIIRQIEFLHNKEPWNVIASFIAQDGEPDITPWHTNALEKGSDIGLPRIGDLKEMSFHRWEKEHELEIGRYGIPQPENHREKISKNQIQWFLVPLVAYDKLGNRLGMGGGYYDRYLSNYQDQKRPFLLGVCFSNQYNNEILPTEDTDIKLDAVVNEEGLFRFN